MNTVDALKKLYKAMAGKDWPYQPNPTDAEVIDKIADDGNAGTTASENDVTLRDYDGTVVASYTADEFLALSAMPDAPAHEGLVSQGWNYSLEKAKAYVSKYGKLNIGQMYATDDGKTRIYIHVEPSRISATLKLGVDGTVDVDWGDGTEHDTLTGSSLGTLLETPAHNYAHDGDYVIKLAINGNAALGTQSLSDHFFDRPLWVKKIELGNSISIGNNAFSYCYNLVSVTIPDGVTSIGNNAFSNCYNLVSVTIPDSVTSIGNNAFSNCYNLVSVTIPDGVTSFGSGAFSSCYNLVSVTIPDGVTSFGSGAFSSCYNLVSVTIPDGVTSIGSGAFSNCYNLVSVTVPDSVTSIGTNAFSGCYNLVSVTIPDGVTSISDNAFSGCYSLVSVTIPDSVTSIGNNAFSNCYNLVSVTIPDSVTSIGSGAFSSCYNLVSVTIPDSVTSIGNNAFSSCYNLVSVTIPDSVTSLGNAVFSGSSYRADYHLKSATPPSIGQGALSPTNGTIIYVPYSADHSILNAYKTATNWSNYASYMREEEAA